MMPEPTKELPIYKGQASLPIPTTAIPYSEPTLVSAPQRRSGLLVVGMLAGALVLAALGVVAGVALTTGNKISGQQGPGPAAPPPAAVASPTVDASGAKQITERFLAAVLDGRGEVIQENLCDLLRSNGSNDSSGGLGLGFIVAYKVGQEQVTGPAATVDVELTLPILDPIKFDIYLIREGGAWRVCGGGPA